MRYVIAMTGASGIAYGLRLLECIEGEKVLVLSEMGKRVLVEETGMRINDVERKANVVYSDDDLFAPIASGSFRARGMIVAPCSVRSMSEIATGVTSTLLTRAADVALKERRTLVLAVRETPLHLGHLRTMAALTEMGAIILPPVPAFYAAPHSLEDLVDHFVARMLDCFGYNWSKAKRWGDKPL